MDSIIADMVQVGIVSLVSSKVAKSIGEKDIGEIIAGTGWIAVGIDGVRLIKPICDTLKGFGESLYNFFSFFDGIVKNLSQVPLLGDIIKRGLVN
jgi:hypothetical protein